MANYYTKQIFVFVFSLMMIGKVHSQYVSIPDTNFRNFLQLNYPACMSGGMLDTTCNAVVNALTLDCSHRNISDLTGIQYFDNLKTLICRSNNLSVLADLPLTLTTLACDTNLIMSFSILPNGLYYLYCSHNNLTSLPSLPDSLIYLDCRYNQLITLPQLPSNFGQLKCDYNQLTALPVLPNNLVFLTCTYNQLSSLPTLPNILVYLYCTGNQLTSLPALPDSLNRLGASYNQLTTLPTLPNGLDYLSCVNNLLTSLPTIPNSVTTINVYSNLLTNLPTLPDSLYNLDCRYNPLTCLPELKRIYSILFTNTQITCLPNYGNVTYSDPPMSTLQLCQPSSGCPTYWNISGKIFLDDNGNCSQDASDSSLHDIKVVLDSASVQLQLFYTDDAGRYSFRTGLGNYQVSVDTNNLPFSTICPASFYQNVSLTVTDSLDSLVNFSMQCNPGYDLIANSISPSQSFFPGGLRTLYLNAGDAASIYNVSCTNTNGSVEAILSGPVSYNTFLGLPPTSVNGDTITWNIADFSTVNPASDFNIKVQVDTTAAIGDTICITLNVYPTSDNIPSNNTLTHCYPVVNSFDPNEKYMEPAGLVDTSTQWFRFTVFFQNTGTAPAEQIYILDTLDTDLDATTFTYLSSSHNVITQLFPGNILRFNYPNINLPDSISDEPGSHGYVQYRVMRRDGLPVNTVISNTAYIYFDFNPAIVTNTVSATLTIPVGINEGPALQFEIYPNPSRDIIHVRLSGQLTSGQLEIIDALGRTVFQKKIHYQLSTINYQLNQGVYFVKVTTEKGTAVRRLVKQ
jgi:uncharacterized repeat protein (TIGR01451 family)